MLIEKDIDGTCYLWHEGLDLPGFEGPEQPAPSTDETALDGDQPTPSSEEAPEGEATASIPEAEAPTPGKKRSAKPAPSNANDG